MILSIPIQSELVEKDNSAPIRQAFSNFENTFVILHPFLKVKNEFDFLFDYYKRSNKKDILNSCDGITWTEIIKRAGLQDIKELDRLLAFLHCARRTADKIGWLKFIKVIQSNNYEPAQVDEYPAILTDPTLELLKQIGYNEIIIYFDTDEKKVLYKTQDLIIVW